MDKLLIIIIGLIGMAAMGLLMYQISLLDEIKKSKSWLTSFKQNQKTLSGEQIDLLKIGICPDCLNRELFSGKNGVFNTTAECNICESKFNILEPMERIL
jgi:hypothetical protein